MNRREFIASTGALLSIGSFAKTVPPEKYNVLFIAIDDLKPLLGCYGDPLAHTPNIDRLAQEGLVFKRAYCQQAICGASRASLLTGRRPDTTGVYYNPTHFRKNLPDIATLPQHFKNSGYHTQALGKLFHGRNVADEVSWSVPTDWHHHALPYHNQESLDKVITIERGGQTRRSGPSWEASQNDDHEHNDGMMADAAIEFLKNPGDKPFFLAVGFHKPHLPFVAPQKYFDLHPLKKFKLARNPKPTKGVPPMAVQNWGELRNYSDIQDKGPLADKQALELIRAYYAAASFADAQVGCILDALDKEGLRDNTIVVLWGDHGWHLGDHGLWCKHTNFENAVHAPLIVSVPGMKTTGAVSEALIEFVDIYPTLAELCGLPTPDGLEGHSFVPVIKEPKRRWKKAAFYQYPRRLPDGRYSMGYCVRTERYRLTEWVTRDTIDAPNNDEVIALELYDYVKDPLETVNLAQQAEYATTVKELTDILHAGWRNSLPGPSGKGKRTS
jgi:iduronate 2-sulfatase